MDHMTVLFLTSYGISIVFSMVAAPIYNSTNSVYMGSLFFTFSPTLVLSYLLLIATLTGELIFHCDLDLHFLNDY